MFGQQDIMKKVDLGDILEKVGLSAGENNADANNVAKKLEGHLAYNLKNKTNVSPGIIDQIKSTVMEKVLVSFTGAAAEKGDKEGNGLMDMLTDNDMVDSLKSKLGGFFK